VKIRSYELIQINEIIIDSDGPNALWPKLGNVEVIAETIVSPAVEMNSVAKVKSKPSNRTNNVTLEKFIEKAKRVKQRNEKSKSVSSVSVANNKKSSIVNLEKNSDVVSATELVNGKTEISVQELWKDKKKKIQFF